MKKIIFIIAILALNGCKKDDPKPSGGGGTGGLTLKFSASSSNPGTGGNQMEFSINGGPVKIISFKNSAYYDTISKGGDTYYFKVSSLDYSQSVSGTVTFNNKSLGYQRCDRDAATPNNCVVTLSGAVQ